MRLSLDKLIDKLAGMGVPGLVFILVAGGVAPSAAAMTAALSFLGGPFGMIGGIGALLLIGTISYWATQVGTEKLVLLVFARWKDQGRTKDELIVSLERYRRIISKGLYQLVMAQLDEY